MFQFPNFNQTVNRLLNDIEQRSTLDSAIPVDHPEHYNNHPSGIECITIVEHFNFNLGNAIKYIWRAGLKSNDPIEDLRKAEWYIRREIERLTQPTVDV